MEHWSESGKLRRIYAILGNAHMSLADRFILITMERLYDLQSHQFVHIQPWRIAQSAGVSKSAVSKFLAAMKQRGYMAYKVVYKQGVIEGHVVYDADCTVAELERCSCPQDIDILDTPSRKENRRKAKERLQCRACGSFDVRIEVHAICNGCGTELA